MDTKFLTVSVKGPNREEFDGLATSVTSLNNKGKFDVLPYHANFITLIKDFVIIQQQDKKQITFTLQTGIIKVQGDKVNVIIGV